MNFPTDWTYEDVITVDASQVSDADTADVNNYPMYLMEDNLITRLLQYAQGKEINSNYLLSDTSLKAYYRFESGALTTDTSGNSHTLSVSSGSPTSIIGSFGGGIQVDGNDSYSASDHADFHPTTGFTISMWIRTASSGTQYLFQSYSQNTEVEGIRMSLVSGVLDIVSGDGTGASEGSDWENARGIRDLGDDEWHHIAGVWDGSYLRAYVDGVQEGSTAWTTAPAYDATNYVRIGCANNSGTDTAFYTGDMDDVALFDRALNHQEIRSIWTGGADLRFTSDEAGSTVLNHEVVTLNTQYDATGLDATSLTGDASLEGYWKLESDGTDETTNNNDLTGTGTPTHTTGKFNNGADLEASTPQYYSIADGSQTGLDITGDISINAWIKLESYGALRPIVSKWDINSQRSYRYGVDANGAIKIDVSSDGATTAGQYKQWISPNGVVPLNKWCMVSITLDISSETCVIYINGYAVTTTVNSGSGVGATIYNGTAPFAIGQDFNTGSSGNDFDGIIDDVSVFSRILEDYEVYDLYRVGASSELYVKCDLDYNDDTLLYVWYGNSSATPFGIEFGTLGRASGLSAYLEGYWKLESDGTDETANNNDLTGSGSPTHTTGFFNNGLDLELSSSQYYSITDNASLSITGDISIMAWIKLEQLPSTAGSVFTIASKDDTTAAANRAYKFEIHTTNNRLRFFYSQGGGNHTASYVENAFRAGDVGKWIHVAVSVDVSAKNIELYINGEKKTVTAELTNATSIQDNSDPFYIGASGLAGSAGNYFDGMIDDLSVYSYALTEGFIGAAYGASNGVWIDTYELVTHDFRYDSCSSRHHNPTFTNGARYISNGALTYGADLDGSDDYITWGSAISNLMTADLTVMALINVDTISSNYKDVFNHQTLDGAGTGESTVLDFMSDGDVLYNIYNRGSITSTETGWITTTDGWQMIASTYDYSTDGGEIFVDGVSAKSGTFTGKMLTSSITHTSIGARYLDGASEVTGTFDGQISEYRIYKNILPDSHIITTYNNLLFPSTFATASSLSDIKELSGVAQASLKKVAGVTEANIGSVSGVAN